MLSLLQSILWKKKQFGFDYTCSNLHILHFCCLIYLFIYLFWSNLLQFYLNWFFVFFFNNAGVPLFPPTPSFTWKESFTSRVVLDVKWVPAINQCPPLKNLSF